MQAALSLWDLDATNQICLTTDNGNNIVSVAGILDQSRLSHFGHNLHLSVTKAIQDDSHCSRVLGVHRKIVSSISMIWKRKREQTKTQTNLNLKEHSLIAISVMKFILSYILIYELCYQVGLNGKNGIQNLGTKRSHSFSFEC